MIDQVTFKKGTEKVFKLRDVVEWSHYSDMLNLKGPIVEFLDRGLVRVDTQLGLQITNVWMLRHSEENTIL